MAEVDGVKASLVQTQALERIQEAARRQGEVQQGNFATTLNHQVEKREHQVAQGEEPEEEALDPEARKQGQESPARKDAAEADRKDEIQDEEKEVGQHLDVRA